MPSSENLPDRDGSGAEPLVARLSVRVQPRSKRESIESIQDGVVRIRVSAPPIDGKANEAVRRLIAKSLNVPRSRVTLVKGSKSRDKVFEISGMYSRDVLDRVRESI
jgi:hypothetical protein